ncbi:hypothetical protein Y032_0027g1514 [Ancylostoma ceylanicum]|uniref:Uncharacterized protein n=1 Tax=Ancylostoma ceylanicum TaxID=53326 RepID=A0A016UTB2_9BILA|nr:hypothetical protein Y032_0027g1514 [Ancylostoma ceylanicum]
MEDHSILFFFKVESSDETIDLERLKRQEPIGFHAQVTLYEATSLVRITTCVAGRTIAGNSWLPRTRVPIANAFLAPPLVT